MSTVIWKKPYHDSKRFLAKSWLKLNPSVKIIGVTGSFGKTNTTRAIFEVLSQKAPALQTDLNLDTVYNLPITILKLRNKHKFLVLEMGVDHKGEMDSYLEYAKPSIGVVTGITPVHSDPGLLGSLEGIMEAKGRLLESLPKDGWAVLNHDDENVRKMAGKTKAQILWYGTGKDCDFRAEKIGVDFIGTSFVLHHNNQQYEVKIGLVGKHFVQVALAAAAAGKVCGLSWEEIITGLEKLKPLPGRLSIEKGPKGTILLDDHLRANPASTRAGLETLSTLPRQGSAKKIAVLGEMGELGEYAQIEHQKIGQTTAKLKIDYLIGIGPLQKLTVEEAIKNGMK
ncbi:MAG: UDP-N-acetylmuramoyl-tripeptide--D-alanyl-D-alanine ligase, partial [bacterium]|nr:UDP-N-acetylmuramoyl-tripeptide--D-alanyl-D-alanine ligase [bacterium]